MAGHPPLLATQLPVVMVGAEQVHQVQALSQVLAETVVPVAAMVAMELAVPMVAILHTQ